jgi:cell division septum initiation protein DivIVA
MEKNNKALIEQLKTYIELLINNNEQLKTENKRLLEENKTLIKQNEYNKTRYEDLDKEIEKMKLAGSLLASSGNSHEAKLKVNKIVREIDKCIALLNK